MIPVPIQKMLMVPGVYLVSGADDRSYTVVHVDHQGVCQQMRFDGVLSPDGWVPDVIVRGPLTEDAPIMAGEWHMDGVAK